MLSLLSFLQNFAASLTTSFASNTPGQPEDQLKLAVKPLLESAGESIGQDVLLRSESRIAGGRPDFAVDVAGVLNGYIELKAPGAGARPAKFSGHDKKQWDKFKSLPNLLYTDGNEWALYREGQLAGQIVRLKGDVISDGTNAVSSENAAALETLLRDYFSWNPSVPSRPRELAQLLAPLCRLLREDVKAAIENEDSGLAVLANEWRASLFPDADNVRFADAYAQTLTYGLLLAKVEGQEKLSLENAAQTLDANHNLLAGALRVLGQPEARAELGVGLDILLRVLDALDPKLWRHLPSGGDADPWLYFYEDFLAEYDRKLRDDAGVYYTPVQVIRAQVRLIDEVLRTRFGKAKGFNDKSVTILDPAAGTGAYPLAILEHALASIHKKQGPGAVAGAATDLASRLHAFEFLVGPYAVAHLRLTQATRAAGGHLPVQGASVFLCDTLESPHSAPPQPSLFTRRLAVEHERARQIKAAQPILVCLGNPPYDRQQRDNPEQTLRGGWVRFGDGSTPAPLEDFLAPAREEGFGGHLKNLYNDYVYFWRWAMWKVFETAKDGAPAGGIVCFISASSYLRGPGFVGMRRVMRETFDELWILDLEGDSRGARPTENVFNIQTGVAIALGIRTGATDASTPARVHYAKITGTRAQKFETLNEISSLEDVTWQDCPTDWNKPFLPVSSADYWNWPELIDLFPWQQSGVKYGRTWPIGETEEVLTERWKALMESDNRNNDFDQNTERSVSREFYSLSDCVLKNKHGVKRQPAIYTLPKYQSCPPIVRYGFRSFDRQWAIADNRLGDRMCPPFWTIRSSKQVFFVGMLTDVLGTGSALVASAHIPDLHNFCNRGGKDVIPLWRDAAATQANVTSGVLPLLSERFQTPVRAEDLFAYCYALLCPRAYVETFAEELLLPGPRVPLTRSSELFARVAKLGHELIRVHTFGERDLENGQPSNEAFTGTARCTKAISPAPENYPTAWHYHENTQTLRVGDGEFAPVPPEVWYYSVSGLQVVRSWLDYRKKEPRGKASSPLDAIRPASWTSQMTEELLEVLWTLERTLEIEPQAAALLSEVLVGEMMAANELPQPTKEERAAPGNEAAIESANPALPGTE